MLPNNSGYHHTQEQLQREVDLMSNPAKWQLSFLPLKRFRSRSGGIPSFAGLKKTPDGLMLFEPGDEIGLRVTPTDVLERGWVVD